ncbi:MAG: OmpP1/FadL family transporter [Candidatus Aminicenantales bacterium]
MVVRRHLALILCLVVLGIIPSAAQTVIGQYEDEAPFRTWNILGVHTAPASGMGEVCFALAVDASSAMANPALLTSLPSFSIAISGSYTQSSFFRYSIVNTGVLYTRGNSEMGLYGGDFAGLSVRFKGWALGLSIGLLEAYDRPMQSPEYEFQGRVLYRLSLDQEGLLRNVNLSLARRLFGRISVGLGVNIVSGTWEKTIEEDYLYLGNRITDAKSHDFSGISFTGGATVDVGERLTVGAGFRSPFTKKAESQSRWEYTSSQENIQIVNQGSGESTFRQPLIIGVGAVYRWSSRFKTALDVAFFGWSRYEAETFGEKKKRLFRNILRVAGGVEYINTFRLFGEEFQVPVRAGMASDPQPMQEPRSAYIRYSSGTGLHWQGLHLDLSAMFGVESGSGWDLRTSRVSLTLSYRL